MASSKILIWNVWGLNEWARRDCVHKVVDAVRPAIVCLQETKLDFISDWDVLAILGSGFGSFVFLPAQHTRGGILVAWRDDSITSLTYRVHLHSVAVHFQNG